MNRAMLVGYYWAHAEAELKMKPLALSGLKGKLEKSNAGHRSGDSRRKTATQGWKKYALELANAEWERNPSASQKDLIDAISEQWRDDRVPKWRKAPSEGSLIPFIRESIQVGDIKRKAPKKKGRFS